MPLKVHFLNVGRGDCTIIEFPLGRVGIVDIDHLKLLDPDTREELLQEYRESMNYLIAKAAGRPTYLREEAFLTEEQAKLTDPFVYYDAHIGKYTDIFRLIVTHPDMDHMTGLYRLHELDSDKAIVNFWHTGFHDFNLAETTDEEWEKCPYDKRDWETYKKLRRGGSGPTSLQNYQGDTGDYWTQDGIKIWAPTPKLEQLAVEREESNILSMVLKITHAGKSIVLGGDATADETWPVLVQQLDLSGVDVLKASHHGRKTGYYGPAVKQMAPRLTITSVGEKEHDATENYRRYSTHTVSLRKAGDIQITIEDDGTLVYSPNVAAHWKPQKT
jgi:beta-lactamase superfamily II metal-dependent hydrolase